MRALKRRVATEVAGSTGTAEVVDLTAYLKAEVGRELRGVKQEYVAELTQASRQAVSKWAREVTMPNPAHLAILAREFPNIYRAWCRCVEGRGE